MRCYGTLDLTLGSVYERIWEVAHIFLAHPPLGVEKVSPNVLYVLSDFLQL